MTKKKIWIALALTVMVALNVSFFVVRARQNRHSEEEARAEVTRLMSIGARMPIYPGSIVYRLNWVGGLVKSSSWNKTLPLAEKQSAALMKLDNLVSSASEMLRLADADYYDTNPVDYLEYKDRRVAAELSTYYHAFRLASLGLLTEKQSAHVIQRILSDTKLSYALSIKGVQELLGMTREQVAGLEINTPMDGILTTNQRKTWSQLAAKRTLPAEPPNLKPLSPREAEAANNQLVGLSRDD